MTKYELIDVVNEADEIIGAIERTPEWNKTRPTACRLINVFVWNTKGQLVLQQRARHKAVSPLLLDTSVGGLVTSGLSYEQAARIEMSEELGIETELQYVAKFSYYCPETAILKGHHCLFECSSDGPYLNWENEAERLEFMTLQEVEKHLTHSPYLFTVGFQEAFKAYILAKE